MKRKKTGFEKFAQKFLITSIVVFIFGIITIKAMESGYNRDYQKLENEIQTLKSNIDGLEMQKQDLVSFNRLTNVAAEKGYAYRSDAVATIYSNSTAVNE